MTSMPLFQATNTPVLVTRLVVLPKFMCWLPPKAHKAMVRCAFEPRELPKLILQSGFLVVGLLSIHSLRSSYPMSLTRFLEFPEVCKQLCEEHVQFFFLFIISSCACTCTPNTMFHSHSAQDLQS